MGIKTFTPHEKYSRNKAGGTEPRKKLNKLKSVKVANLDRLRLSMRIREKSRFDQSFVVSSTGSSSTPMSGTSSPNYMKATSSSSARKRLSQTGSADTASVNIPVEIVRPRKGLKRLVSVKRVNKLTSMKSMKIRAKYSQFQEFSLGEMLPEDKPESSEASYGLDKESMVGGSDQPKSILNRSRSIKMTRLRSKRYTRRLPKSRLGDVAQQMSYGNISNLQPHYMKGTSSHEARKQNSETSLTRTSSWRPLKILAKIPSLRQRKSKVKKRPMSTPLSSASVGRATCSSTLRRSEFPDHLELLSGGQEATGISSVHVCPYTYCSLNGHHHHAPSPPLKDFISAKRKLMKNQKGRQLTEDVENSTSAQKTDRSVQMVSTEINAAQTLNPTPEEDDDGLDFLVTIYAKPRKKWAKAGTLSSNSEALSEFTDDKTFDIDYDGEVAEATSRILSPEGRHDALNEDLQEPHAIFAMRNVEGNKSIQQKITTITTDETTEPFISEEKIPSSGGNLINILSDEQKYTNIWHLIYQQFVSTDMPTTAIEGITGADEREGGDVNTCPEGNELEQEQSRFIENHNADVVTQVAATDNPDFDQTAALKFVQEGLKAILERDSESMNQQLKSEKDTTNTSVPEACAEEQMKADPSAAEIPRQQMSKSYKRLRNIFVTAKIMKAMERMKRIRPRQPRYLSAEPTSEREKVYLRHLSRDDRKNTEEWMLDYALRWAISRLGPDQQKKVGQLVEAFEMVTPEQKGGIRHYPVKAKLRTTSDLATPVDGEFDQTTSISDDQINHQQDDESLLSHKSGPEETRMTEVDEYQTTAADFPLELSGNSCNPIDIQVDSNSIVNEPMTIPEESSQSPTGESHTAEMNIFVDKQKYTRLWNLIYLQVASTKTSMDGEQGANGLDEEQQADNTIKCKEINDPESTGGRYSTNPNEEVDDQNAAGGMNESDQSAAVKLVKEALSAILTQYERSNEYQAVPDKQSDVSCTDESLRNDGTHLKKESNVSNQELQPDESETPPREKSKSYNRLRKAFVTAKFINAIQRLRMNSPRKTQSLPAEGSLKDERVYLRHLSIGERKFDEECMLDYALRQVISKMAPDKQRRVAQLVEAFETVIPHQKERGLIDCPTENETAQPQANGVLQDDHDLKSSTAGDAPPQKILEPEDSESITELSPIISSSNADNVAKVEGVCASACFPEEDSEVKSSGVIATILSDKQIYTSMWQLIHQQVVSSEASKSTKQVFNEVDEEEEKGEDINFPNSTRISCTEKVQQDNDIHSAVLNQSAAIKLVKEAINAILQRDEQNSDQHLHDDDKACHDAKGLCDTSVFAPTEEYAEESEKRAEKDSPMSDNISRDVDVTVISLQEQAEEKATPRKMPSSHSKLKRLIVTAKFIAAMERMRKMNWTKTRFLPANEAPMDERVYLRHLSIDGRRNHDEWMLDYALRKVISSLAPEQQRRVASLVGAFETVAPTTKRMGLERRTKVELPLAVKSDPMDDEKEFVEFKDDSVVYNDHCPNIQDDIRSRHKSAPLERKVEDEYETDNSTINPNAASEALNSDQMNLQIHHQATFQDCPVQEPLKVSEDTDDDISETPQSTSSSEKRDREYNVGKSLFSDKQKTNSMWHLICHHLQSASAAEGGSERSAKLSSNGQKIKDDKSIETMTGVDHGDNDDDASSVTSELTENDATKLMKQTIDDILDGSEDADNKLLAIATLHTPTLEKDQIVAQKPVKSVSTGYSKLRNLIICKKFIKTMQKLRKIHPQRQMDPTLYSGVEVEKARLKSSGAGEKKGTDEWMLDNVLQKVISGLAPAKQRRVALLVEAFEKVHPEQGGTGTRLANMKKEPAAATFLFENAKENEETVFESSERPSESSETISNMKLAIDRVPRDIGEDRALILREDQALNGEEMKGDTPLQLTALPSAEVSTSSDDEHKVPPNEMKTIEEQLTGQSDQVTKVNKKTSFLGGLKGEGNHNAPLSKSSDRENNTSLWGLILQHVKTEIPEKAEMKISTEIDTDCDSENSSQVTPKGFHDKEVDIPTPTSFEFYESEAVQLVQQAINELLILPEQESNNQPASSSTNSEGRETSSASPGRGETSADVTATPDDKEALTNKTSPSTYAKLSRAIMCKRFIHTMSKMRQLKPQPPQEHSHLTDIEAKETRTLRQTANGEKKSWEEGMLDHALQQVVGKLAPAEKKRVALLVQAFEAVGEQPATSMTVGSFSGNRKPTKFRLSRSQVV